MEEMDNRLAYLQVPLAPYTKNVIMVHLFCDNMCIPYSLDQTPLSISRRSRIVAAPPEVLNEIVAALE